MDNNTIYDKNMLYEKHRAEREAQKNAERAEREAKRAHQKQLAIAQKAHEKQLAATLKLANKKASHGVDYVDYDIDMKAKITIPNLVCILDYYGIKTRYNEMNKNEEIYFPNVGNLFGSNVQLSDLLSLCLKHNYNITMQILKGYISSIAAQNPYHPVVEWLDTIVWDGVDRMQQFYNTIVVQHEHNPNAVQLKELLMRKWALSAVAALYHPNFSSEGVLIFVGNQGIGKTSWMFKLLPKHMQDCLKDSLVLNVNNKDSVKEAISYWIVELGEIGATFKKQDIEHIKAFCTSKVDVYRPPYAVYPNNYARKTVFFGSVNTVECLFDDENRRFWTLNVEKTQYTNLDVQQFWAQMKVMYESIKHHCMDYTSRIESGEYGWYLSPEERKLLHISQDYNRTIDPLLEELSLRVVPYNEISTKDMSNMELLNCTQILKAINKQNITRSDTNKTAMWLRQVGYTSNSDKKFRVLMKNDVQEYLTSKSVPSKNLKINEIMEIIGSNN